MKLNNVLNNYYEASASLSKVTRQLAFAGIAICWLFVIKPETSFIISKDLIDVLLFFVYGLFFDLMQYIYTSAAWGSFHRCKEKELSPFYNKELGINYEENVSVPKWINWPTLLFFWGKSIFVVIGYLQLSQFLLLYVEVR